MESVGEEELPNHPPVPPRLGPPNLPPEALALILYDGSLLWLFLLLPTTE